MRRRSFISVVVPVDTRDGPAEVSSFLNWAGGMLDENFTDYEIILVDNRSGLNVEDLSVASDVRNNCYVVQLAKATVWDLAVIAGLERANGDYVANFDTSLVDDLTLIVQMYDLAQQGIDIAYLRGDKRRTRTSWRRWAFYRIVNTTSQTRLDPQALHVFMVSRRALNWIIRNRSRSQFLNEAFFTSGYPTKPLDVDVGVAERRRSRSEETRLAWGVLTRITTFPLMIGQWAIALMVLGCAAAIANALTVRFFQLNIFMQPEVYVPGWAFIVILVSGGLVVTNMAIYALLRMLYVILDEIKTEPRYVVERFGRL